MSWRLHPALALLTVLSLHAPARAGEAAVTPEAAVSAFEQAYGVHPGQRRNHAKGTCATGSFTGTAEAGAYSRSALFSGNPVPVVARFSVAGGNPGASDTEKSPRGMALEFRLPANALQHMTMINTPMFLAKVPQTFVDLLLASVPVPATGKPDPAALKSFAEHHPESRPFLDFLAKHNPPLGFDTSAYYGIHTFKFIDKNDKVTLVRWRFVPQEGEKRLTDAQLMSMPHDFLEQALIARTKTAPARWDMLLTIGKPDDVQNDPTVLWPKDRKEFKAGTLAITSAMNQRGAECEKISYDPLTMADGIEPTDDPVLLFRSPAYGVSLEKRIEGK